MVKIIGFNRKISKMKNSDLQTHPSFQSALMAVSFKLELSSEKTALLNNKRQARKFFNGTGFVFKQWENLA